ncbi:pseudouridine synthase [Chitinilyticum piscinae]|uniref:RNA pseudouridine synthase n=1 Tax=Chitinilyticum piscinae TaxID=2866724 RepID=A0A8J7K184_9NEIS|nr:pseudouridine synthase [Chitinilyticum piscinae]MBE9608287.1 RNA pseudouridine synthase [Chitinilyticum piscinae]
MNYAPPADTGLDLVYADDHLVVVNKPAGLLSVPGRGEHKLDCMVARVQAEFPDALTVHRLDMDTSGLLVYGRGAAMQRALSILFMDRHVDKRYVALAEGRLPQDSGSIDLPLNVDWPNRPKHRVDFEEGKPSLTRFEVLAYDAALDATRVALEPVTGRSHQLRVHLLAIGHPILGDTLYASPAGLAKSPRLCLHAEYLALPHPVSGERLAWERTANF